MRASLRVRDAFTRRRAQQDVARQERIENDKEVSTAVRELALAQGAQEAARQNLENSQAELQKLKAELDGGRR